MRLVVRLLLLLLMLCTAFLQRQELLRAERLVVRMRRRVNQVMQVCAQ